MKHLGNITVNKRGYKLLTDDKSYNKVDNKEISVFTIMGHIISIGSDKLETSYHSDIELIDKKSNITIIATIFEREIIIKLK